MGGHSSSFDIAKCARPNILALEPYRCARDDYKDDGTNVLLDANENAFGPGLDLDKPAGSIHEGLNSSQSLITENTLPGLHRYPDPHQNDLKTSLSQLRNTHDHTKGDLTPANLFVGNGSDEAIGQCISVCLSTFLDRSETFEIVCIVFQRSILTLILPKNGH